MIDPFGGVRLMWLLFGAMIVACLSFYSRAHAYIPRSKTILERTAKKHGTGMFLISQDVTLQRDRDKVTVREQWVVDSSGALELEMQGAGAQFTGIYKDDQKYTLDGDSETALPIPSDFFEDYFHIRAGKALTQELIQDGILPASAVRPEPRWKNLKEVSYPEEPFVRLARTGGTLTYGIGTPTPAHASRLLPGIWIEQDKFLIRRIRFPSQVEVVCDDYGEFPNNLTLPRFRTVTWGDNSAQIRITKVTPLKTPNEFQNRLNVNSLRSRNSRKLQAQWGSSSLAPVIKEFYSQLR